MSPRNPTDKMPTTSSLRKSTLPKSGLSKIAKYSTARAITSRSKPKLKSQSERKKVMQDTIEQTQIIMKSTPGGLATSTFLNKQLMPLARHKCPNVAMKPVRFILGDTFVVTRQVMGENEDSNNKVAVLNMASDERVAGARGIPSGPTQEDALCYSSTLYETLKAQKHNYPWKKHLAVTVEAGGPCNLAAIFSPSVVIFKNSSEKDYANLKFEERRTVGVVSVAAPRGVQSLDLHDPVDNKMRDDMGKKLTELREKIRLIYRVAGSNSRTVLVLGAFGCGSFKCDPKVVAAMFYEVLMREEEFRGWFEHVVFAIYTQKMLDIFKHVWEQKK